MSWMIMPTPGDDALCKGACKHVDCAQYRKEAKWECHLCHKPLGFSVKVTRYGPADDFGTPPMVHFVCALRDLDRIRAG